MSPSSTSRLASSCLCFVVLFLVLAMAPVESRPARQRSDNQILRDLFGQQISSLVLADERSQVTEGSASGSPALLPHVDAGHSPSENVAPPLQRPVPSRRFLQLLSHQRKFNNRNRKSTGRGCFGLKVDRISIMSGLGC